MQLLVKTCGHMIAFFKIENSKYNIYNTFAKKRIKADTSFPISNILNKRMGTILPKHRKPLESTVIEKPTFHQ